MIMKRYFNVYIIVLVGFSILFSRCNFGAGSYANASYYAFDIQCDTLVDRIIKLKTDNPQYKNINHKTEVEDRIDKYNFYNASFFIPCDSILLGSIINLNSKKNDKNISKIGIYGIIKHVKTDSAKFYQINDLDRIEKKKILKIFETEILDKLGKWEKY